jgi:catechol 2,3-dioxygenase-like lactoylglutathione lyase family enzyme
MAQTLGYVALVVRDYDEALAFFTHSLGFTVIEDTTAQDRLGNDKRWVLVSPPGSRGSSLLLARASTPEEASRIGNQTGGRVFLFLHTDDFWRDYREMLTRGVKFREAPRQEAYGTVAVFEDLYGNKWDLLELKDRAKG